MEGILSAQVSVSMSQLVVVLALVSVSLIFGHIKLSVLIGYSAILYWSRIWEWPLFMESGVSKFSGLLLAMTCLMVLVVLFSALSLLVHRD